MGKILDKYEKYWKNVKNSGKVREICQSEKVGTMLACSFTVTLNVILFPTPCLHPD